MDFDLEALSASVRLQLNYDRVELGQKTWDAPVPLALCVGSVVVYIAVFLLSHVTPIPSESGLERLKKLHNYALSAYSGFCCGYTVWWLLSYEHTTVDRFMCSKMAGSGAELVFTSFTLSKIWEWGDTILLVWGNRVKGRSWVWNPKTVLHCFHHSTTFWLFLVVSNMPCAVKTGTLLNGGVHTIMYFYYADPSIFPKKLIPFITQGQIAQLVTVTVLWVITPWVCASDELANFPRDHLAEYVTGQIFVPIYIIMFLSFYSTRFKKSDTKPKKN